ncbi:hypothetical protein [Halobacillus amylolyticus]|uniref:Uncharacterized protein n=1 Tax=Halobacillus amylolyticus TaxID=2932259 RepID=A0ABY4HG49_9BACI|nr:hypothetical protein [Halobacillus amylolyticus]UOR12410.1 hypothetical protein MUO15_02495 [Halobacillus amylolyticus]
MTVRAWNLYRVSTDWQGGEGARNGTVSHSQQQQYGPVGIDKAVEEEVIEAVKSIKLDAFNLEKGAFDFDELDSRKVQLTEYEKQYNEASIKALSNTKKLFDDIMSGKSDMSMEFVSKKLEEYGKRKRDLLTKIENLKKEIEEAEVTSKDLDKLKYQLENWVETYSNSTDIDEKRMMLSKVLNEVVVVINKEANRIRSNVTVEKALDGRHTVFGKVIDAVEIIDRVRPGDVMHSVRVKMSKLHVYERQRTCLNF